MTRRDELVLAFAGQYALGSRADRRRMLDEFAALACEPNHPNRQLRNLKGKSDAVDARAQLVLC